MPFYRKEWPENWNEQGLAYAWTVYGFTSDKLLKKGVNVENTKDMIGKEILIKEGPEKNHYFVKCRIVAVRSCFGRVDMKVEPIEGKGQKWMCHHEY